MFQFAHTFECERVMAAGKRMEFKDVKTPGITLNKAEQWQIQRHGACGNMPQTVGSLPSIKSKTVFLSHYVCV